MTARRGVAHGSGPQHDSVAVRSRWRAGDTGGQNQDDWIRCQPPRLDGSEHQRSPSVLTPGAAPFARGLAAVARPVQTAGLVRVRRPYGWFARAGRRGARRDVGCPASTLLGVVVVERGAAGASLVVHGGSFLYVGTPQSARARSPAPQTSISGENGGNRSRRRQVRSGPWRHRRLTGLFLLVADRSCRHADRPDGCFRGSRGRCERRGSHCFLRGTSGCSRDCGRRPGLPWPGARVRGDRNRLARDRRRCGRRTAGRGAVRADASRCRARRA